MSEELKRYDESWETEAGLPDDFDFWVIRSEFGYLAEYSDAQGNPLPLLIWHGESDEGFEGPVTFSLGRGWEPSRDGRTVTNVEKKKRRFTRTSMMGRLIDRIKELGALDAVASRGPATDAKIWEGTGWHLKREEFEYKGLLADRGGKTSRLMPVAFLGVRGEAGSGPTLAGETGEADNLRTKLVELAKNLGLKEFQRAAMSLPEVVSDMVLVQQIVDDSEAGFWHRAREGKV